FARAAGGRTRDVLCEARGRIGIRPENRRRQMFDRRADIRFAVVATTPATFAARLALRCTQPTTHDLLDRPRLFQACRQVSAEPDRVVGLERAVFEVSEADFV